LELSRGFQPSGRENLVLRGRKADRLDETTSKESNMPSPGGDLQAALREGQTSSEQLVDKEEGSAPLWKDEKGMSSS